MPYDFLFKQSSSANRDGFISFCFIFMPLQTRQSPCLSNVLDIAMRQKKKKINLGGGEPFTLKYDVGSRLFCKMRCPLSLQVLFFF